MSQEGPYSLVDSIAISTDRFLENISEHGIPQIASPRMDSLNLQNTHLAAGQRDIDYGYIVREIEAFGEYEEIRIDECYSLIVGTSLALDPHTYLRLPIEDIVSTFRRVMRDRGFGGNDKCSVNGLPEHIVPIDPEGKIYAPLHLVSWLLLRDKSSEAQKYSPFDALSFLADPVSKLRELGCGAKDEDIKIAINSSFESLVRSIMINRSVISELYNTKILPAIVETLSDHYEESKSRGGMVIMNIPEDRQSDVRAYLGEILTCNELNQRCYFNIGHSVATEREKYDTGRGPASLEPLHMFTRYVPFDRWAMLIGNRDSNLTNDERNDFDALMEIVARSLPGGPSKIISIIKPEETITDIQGLKAY
jgi:hypothetical protein